MACGLPLVSSQEGAWEEGEGAHATPARAAASFAAFLVMKSSGLWSVRGVLPALRAATSLASSTPSRHVCGWYRGVVGGSCEFQLIAFCSMIAAHLS